MNARPTKLSLAEHIRIALQPARFNREWLLLGIGATLLSAPATNAVELPRPCASGTCGNTSTTAAGIPITFVKNPSDAGYVMSGSTGIVQQNVENVTLNWQSFNISADGHVIFSQPSTNSIALNRIFQGSPSSILGSISTQLNSDPSKTGGQVYMVNPNGFVFGSTATVNAAGILVSTLGMSEDTFSKGLLSSIANAKAALGEDQAAAKSFVQATHQYVQDTNGNDLWFDEAGVVVPADTPSAVKHEVQLVAQSGATMQTTKPNGRILLASQLIDNSGSLTANNGQIILAAGDKVYISPTNADGEPLRGLFVEVGGDGAVINQLQGQLNAAKGDVTIAALAINQKGRISASTSVTENGSVHLLARSVGELPGVGDRNGVRYWQPKTTGSVTLGSSSNTEVNPEKDDPATAVDAQTQTLSSINIFGQQIIMQGGANITAHGGALNMTATSDPGGGVVTDPTAHIRIDSGATIDLSGSNATRSVADNIVTVELRGNELADSPDQRNGALRGKAVTVDARVGTSIANVQGAIDGVKKTVTQRTSVGGVATFVSNGDVVTSQDARIDVSGGKTTYTGAMVNTSQLITADGKIVDIGSAKADGVYVGVLSPSVAIKHDRWGVIEQVGQQTGGHYEAGYIHGSSAGAIKVDAPIMVLNATMLGHASNGAYQRDPNATTYATGGQLVIGDNNSLKNADYHAPSVTITAAVPTIVVADDANLIAGMPLRLSTEYLLNGGFTNTQIYSNETVTVSNDATLHLLAGSSLKIRASQVNMNAGVKVPAGTVDLAAVATVNHIAGGGINIADNLVFDVNGAWINDTEVDNTSRPIGSLFQNAGSISVVSSNLESALNIGNNVRFSADGGAWLKSSNTVVGGKGGGIALQSNGQDTSFQLGKDVALSAFGVNGVSGGTFTLSAGRVQIDSGTTWASQQTYNPLLEDGAAYFNLGSSLFREHGFGNFNIVASGGSLATQGDSLQVAAPHIDTTTSTLLLSSQLAGHASGEDIHGFSTVTTLLPYQRAVPSTLNLAVTPYSAFAETSLVGTLELQQGAEISGDPGLNVNLSSKNGSIDINGSVFAPAGVINTHIYPAANVEQAKFDATLGIHVGDTAVLSTSGSFVATPSEDGFLRGTLRDGGSIALIADRGAVTLAKGSVLNVSGTSADLDIATPQSKTPYHREKIASNAGAINLVAAESIVIEGDLQAKAGLGDTGNAFGGSLSIAVIGPGDASASMSSRIAQLTNDVIDTSTDAVSIKTSEVINSTASISAVQVKKAGFDSLSLRADNIVKIDAGTDLSLQRRLQLDAPVIETGDGVVNLLAGYVSLGSSIDAATTASASAGMGELIITAGNIEIVGSSALQNIAVSNLKSDGDIRLRGTIVFSADGLPTLLGDLNTAGALNLQATRIYGTTITKFTINAGEHDVAITHGPQTSSQSAASMGVPLSAASGLTIKAANISQDGTLFAPFGSIDLIASDSLTLGSNSVTSVSAEGAVIPFGTTDANGKTWRYNGGVVPALPDRTIKLVADVTNIAKGAVVDVSGGGDLYASEWIKGPGGTNDAFDFKLDSAGNSTKNLTNPALFAIIPSLGTQLAPYDPSGVQVSNALGLQAGDSIYLNATGQLAAGFYTLMPARYSLLPGSYLVSAVSSFNNMQPGAVVSLPDGTHVVAGYRSFGSTGLGNVTYTGFAVHSGTWGRTLAEYHDSFASNFFSKEIHKTVDAGRLGIVAGSALSANGMVNTSAAKGGESATIDVSANNLQIVGTMGTGITGVVQLQDSAVNSWKSGRLLLGGTHSADGNTITVESDNVTIASDAHLVSDEVTLVARNQISVDAGGSVQTSAAVNHTSVTLPTATAMTLTGAGANKAALVVVSDLDNRNWLRDESGDGTAQGTVNLAAGSILASSGSLMVDAPGGANLDGAIIGNGAQWTLASSHIVLGDNVAADQSVLSQPILPQLTISQSLLNSMQSAGAIHLLSSGSIDFTTYAADTNNVIGIGIVKPPSDITLRATVINAINNGTNSSSVTLVADTINLRGMTDASNVVTPIAGAGTFTAKAQSINVTDNQIVMNGFAQATLQAGQVKISNLGTFSTNGNLDITTSRLTAGAASNGVLAATGDVTLSNAGLSTLPVLELGGGITIQGNNVTDDTTIVSPSAIVALQAANKLSLGTNATIDVSGIPVYAAGVRADSNGGVIRLNAAGDVRAASGSQLRVAGSGNSNAGSISVQTASTLDLQSTLNAHSLSETPTGAIVLSARNIVNVPTLNDAMQDAGFNKQQSVHVQQGNLSLSQGKQVSAHDVQWVTDAGTIQVDGTMIAKSTDDRSSIRLYGADGVTVNGQLNADGDSISGRGGIIEVGVSTDTDNHPTAQISLASKAVITADGAELGRLRLRAPVLNGDDVAIDSVPTDLSKLSQVIVEAVLPRYTTATTTTFTSAKNAATTFFNDASANVALTNNLQLDASKPDNKVVLSPGIEIDSAGDVTLPALDLYTWNINSHQTPVALTVRSGGTINLSGTISDGFTSSGTGTRRLIGATNTPSATLRFVAGSNLGSADPLAIVGGQNPVGDIVLKPNAIVRTGTGDLSMVAGNDIKFDIGTSVYTGGTNTPDQTQIIVSNTGASSSFLLNGGQLLIDAGHDVQGSALTQGVPDWQPRSSCPGSNCGVAVVNWGVDLRQFHWNAGTLGGGDVVVNAGHDVSVLSAAAVDSGIVSIDRSAIANYGGGSLDIHAGNDVDSGMIYVGHRSGSVVAENAIANAIWNNSVAATGLFVAMGDARIDLNARSGISLASIVNPTSFEPAGVSGKGKFYFFTYGEDSAVSARSVSGDIVFMQAAENSFYPFFGTGTSAIKRTGVGDLAARILPPNLSISALNGDVRYVGLPIVLYPSDRGELSVYASGSIDHLAATMSDASNLFSPASPWTNSIGFSKESGIDTGFGAAGRVLTARHIVDEFPVTITAGYDIDTAFLNLPKAVYINAGRDIAALDLHAQNLSATDVSEVVAGRDLLYPEQSGVISVAGPGQLDVIAGRNVDLGSSFGIETTGRLSNPNIDDPNGASIALMAGMASNWDVPNFVDNIIAKSDAESKSLVDFVNSITGKVALTTAEAVTAFKSLTTEQQRPFVLKTFFSELVASGHEANTDSKKGYSRGYAAIDALLPKSRSNNPYLGDIDMLFSRVYTLAGGNIDMLIPGGQLNVGVASRPGTVTLIKPPGQLGIVAQQSGNVNIFANNDVSVNSSRVFTLGGGDIAIWSTLGNIDAGKGAKTSLSIPPPATIIDDKGNVTLDLGGAVAGSGIRTIQTNPIQNPGNVDLIAPTGFVDAGDAGIGAAGNINIAAMQVVGAENINFGGSASGVPAATSGIAASLSGAAAAGGSNEKSAARSLEDDKREVKEQSASMADTALSWLDVFVVGLGEDSCKQDDIDCLKRQKTNQ